MPGNFQVFYPRAKHQRVRGACRDAGRLLSLPEAFETHRAFLDFRVPFTVLEFRHVKGAGSHAVAAAYTLVSVPGDRPCFCFFHRLCRAGAGTGGLVAVHALSLDKHVTGFCFVLIDDHPLLVAR